MNSNAGLQNTNPQLYQPDNLDRVQGQKDKDKHIKKNNNRIHTGIEGITIENERYGKERERESYAVRGQFSSNYRGRSK